MPDASATVISTLVRYLVRSVQEADGDAAKKAQRDVIKGYSLRAFSQQQKGVTVTSFNFENGNSMAEITCSPTEMMNACEQALLQTDPCNPGAMWGGNIMNEDMSRTFIET